MSAPAETTVNFLDGRLLDEQWVTIGGRTVYLGLSKYHGLITLRANLLSEDAPGADLSIAGTIKESSK